MTYDREMSIPTGSSKSLSNSNHAGYDTMLATINATVAHKIRQFQ